MGPWGNEAEAEEESQGTTEMDRPPVPSNGTLIAGIGCNLGNLKY